MVGFDASKIKVNFGLRVWIVAIWMDKKTLITTFFKPYFYI